MQILFAIVLSLLLAASFDYLYKDILQTLIRGITENIRNNGTVSSSTIVDSIQIIRAKNFLGFFSIAVSITLIFSYIIARMTLIPTRNAMKSQKRFVSDIAHEVRTPLSVIKTNIEVSLLDENLDSESKKIFLSTIEELDRVSTIINNLLTFNNLVHPEHIKFVSVNLADVVDTAVKKLDELVKKREIQLTIKKISPYMVLGNMIALEQIVINLVKNAINYNNIGGSVVVKVEPDPRGFVMLTVEDSGIGISQEDLVHIFEPFYRAEKARSRQYGSSGLGLAIVSELVKLHSGKISVRTRLKQGTTITVVLPNAKNTSVDASGETAVVDEVSINF